MSFANSARLCFGRRAVVTAALVGCLGLGLGAGMATADEATTDVKWPDPQTVLTGKTYNDDGSIATQHVLAAAKGTYNVLPLWLGIDDTVTNSPLGMEDGEVTADAFRTSGLFGTYASPANVEPDVYMSNLFYSYVTPDSGLSAANRDEIALVVSGQPTAADTTIAIGGTANSLYFRPDLIVGGNQTAEELGGVTAYQALIDAINDGSIGADNYVEGDETYSPYVMDGWNGFEGSSAYQGSVRGTAGILYNMADVVERVKADDPTKVTRYGNDAYAIAEQYEELFLGAQSSILKAIDEGTVEKKTIAVVTSVDKDTKTAVISYADPSFQLGNANIQAESPHFALQDLTDNLAYVLADGGEPHDTAQGPVESEEADAGQGSGKGQGGQKGQQGGKGGGAVKSDGGVKKAPGGSITISLEELAQADMIFYTGRSATGVSQADAEDAFAAAGVTEIPTGIFVQPSNVGTGSYDADKCIYYLNYLGCAYPEVLKSTDLLSYFYSTIAHVSDDYLANVMALNCANMTLVGDDTLAHDGAYYLERREAVQQVIDDGMSYLTGNLDAIVAEHPNLEPIKDADGNFRNRNLGL